MIRTRQDLDREFADTLRGLLMESFAQAQRSGVTNHAANGDMMYRQLIRAKELLDRIHDFYCPKKEPAVPPTILAKTPEPAKNGKH